VARRKKKPKPTSEELEAQADAILEADRDKSAQILAEISALRECYDELRKPSNDPEYLRALQTHEARRNAIANKVQTIHIVPDGPDKTWVAVGLADPRNKAEAHDVARRMGEHFEAKIISHEPEEPMP
jgi:hypothetical protein